jgi:serine/threonine protein kinase
MHKTDIKMSNFAQRWLESSDSWQHFNLGPGWKGKKILGRGSYGIAGLWEYEGSAETVPAIKQVVVKQTPLSAYDKDEDPYIEGKILQLLAEAKSRHIIELYGPPREEAFNGEKVIRLFLEYCPGGTLEKLMEDDGRKERVSKRPLLEADVWAIFFCLALGVAVMDRGTEDQTLQSSKAYEIAHYE